jgi:hypothetical protein
MCRRPDRELHQLCAGSGSECCLRLHTTIEMSNSRCGLYTAVHVHSQRSMWAIHAQPRLSMPYFHDPSAAEGYRRSRASDIIGSKGSCCRDISQGVAPDQLQRALLLTW